MNNEKAKLSIIPVGLAIFSMFFGAGNLIFVVNVGKEFQNQTPLALAAFMVTAVILPVVGIASILLYDGDYKAFFGRIGKTPGFLLCFFCFLIVGPFVAIPRVVTLSYTMFSPFLPGVSLPLFAVAFLLLTFMLTVTESRIIDLLGLIISPLLVVALVAIFIAGFFHPAQLVELHRAPLGIVTKNLQYGYNTLDFLSSIFFGSIVFSILQKSNAAKLGLDRPALERFGIRASIFGMAILGLIYVGLTTLGALFGHHAENLNEAEVLREIIFLLLGNEGAFVMCVAVLMACLSTIIAQSAVSAEYFQKEIFNNRLHYRSCLVIAVVISGIVSILGLSTLIQLSKPIIAVVHPCIIVLAIANLLYKKYNFKPVKSLVFGTLAISVWAHQHELLVFWQELQKI